MRKLLNSKGFLGTHLRAPVAVPPSRGTLCTSLKRSTEKALRLELPMGQGSSALRTDRCSVFRAQDRSCVTASDRGDNGDLWIIVGLGNPGPRYEGNRHNVGFQAIDSLAKKIGVRVTKLQFSAAVAKCSFEGQRILLTKPMTFMNNSGEAVGRLARFYKVPSERVVVIYDDLDIPTATVRLRPKGGHGGHNGMRSLAQHLGGNNFPRIRIGVGRPPGGSTVIQHVLQDFNSKEQKEIDVAVQEAIVTLATIFKLGMEKALSGLRVS